MQVGLVGFSGSGKSTLFQLLTGATPDPGKVHAGQVGVATLADPRLDFLAELHKPKKVTPATVEMLAEYLTGCLQAELAQENASNLRAIDMEVEENFGQSATFRVTL